MKKTSVVLIVCALICTFAVSALAQEEPFTIIPPQPAKIVFTMEEKGIGEWQASLKNEGVIQEAAAEGELPFSFEAVHPGEAVLEMLCREKETGDVLATQLWLIEVDEEGNLFARSLDEIEPLQGKFTGVSIFDDLYTVETESLGEVAVRFPKDQPLPVDGEEIRIWHNGVMTMSLPGQLTAIAWETVPSDIAR